MLFRSQFLHTRTDSAFFRYSLGLYHFSVLTLIRLFSGTRPDCFSILARIHHFSDTRLDYIIFDAHNYSTLFRYSPGQFLHSRTDSAVFRYSFGLYHFSVLTLIRLFSGTRPDSLSILARILPFSDTRSDNIIFWCSHLFDCFRVLARIL